MLLLPPSTVLVVLTVLSSSPRSRVLRALLQRFLTMAMYHSRRSSRSIRWWMVLPSQRCVRLLASIRTLLMRMTIPIPTGRICTIRQVWATTTTWVLPVVPMAVAIASVLVTITTRQLSPLRVTTVFLFVVTSIRRLASGSVSVWAPTPAIARLRVWTICTQCSVLHLCQAHIMKMVAWSAITHCPLTTR